LESVRFIILDVFFCKKLIIGTNLDVLVRIPIDRDLTKSFTNISYRNEAEDGDKRIYFGPVTLYKFRIRLLNDKGLLVDLNNMDWSFSLLVNQIYQY